eukprot:CAMPEP_0182427692 /NCGR_PEP_ID=MMETSP1167-20130531/18988_1 /TAXON_ID=2988 /ORGANISM="Mallomonas Sp, Strain CCMP3275" /LENGTH=311 /DNA_ID=CAMNT_0024610115 /DNA_START=112 /DNA_END=1047 /DNA_ORIENTATION=-
MEEEHSVDLIIQIVGAHIDVVVNATMYLEDDIGHVKEIINEKLASGLPPYEQIVLCDGQPLEDKTTLAEICTPSDSSQIPHISLYIAVIKSNSRKSSKVTHPLSYVVDDMSLEAASSWVQSVKSELSGKTEKELDIEKERSSKAVDKMLEAISASGKTTAPSPSVSLSLSPPPPPPPRWVDIRLISRIAVALLIFGQGLPPLAVPLVFLVLVIYYIIDTGIGLYLLHKLNFTRGRGSGANIPPTQTPEERERERQGLPPLPPPPSLSPSLSHRRWLQIPTSSGLVLDGASILLSLCLSLFPGWNPDGSVQL